MAIKDWTKLIIALGVLVSVSALVWAGKTPSEQGIPVIAALLGYVFGNAHGIMERRKI